MATKPTISSDKFWWLIALPPLLSSESVGILFLVSVLAFLLSALLSWSHRGGPAWGTYWRRTNRRETNGGKRLPGPRGIPVIGSLGLMRGLSHRNLSHAASEHGATRLMAFSIGTTRTIVTSHPDVAKEILQGTAFCDRPAKQSAHGLTFDRAIGFAPYGSYWRLLRRTSAGHLFCPRRIAAQEGSRLEIAARMCARVSGSGPRVRVRDVLRQGSLEHLMECVFGTTEYDPIGSDSVELGELIQEGYDLLDTLDLADHLPFLAGLDLQRIRYRCSLIMPRVHRFLERIINEHRSVKDQKRSDFVDVLLSLSGGDKLSDPDMVAILWEMIFRGVDTVAVACEWVLARLVLHPQVQAKVHEELDRVVGGGRPLQDSDVPQLAYLQAVVKEVLRLHPPGPLLSWARLSTEDATVAGFHVPAGTTAFVNMWAIGRDSELWSDPLQFRPERFLSSGPQLDLSILGSDLRLAPFGSGRRSCPGKVLGLAVVHAWIGYLLHEFTWSAPNGSDRPVDLSEVLRLSCEMASPLLANVVARRT